MAAADNSNPTKIQDEMLSRILSNIVRAYRPVEVWLFGSRFRGDARPTSDWDLLVLVDDDAEDELFDPYLGWQTSRGCGLHADIVVETVGNFNGSVNVATSLAREINTERRRLYIRP